MEIQYNTLPIRQQNNFSNQGDIFCEFPIYGKFFGTEKIYETIKR